METLAREVTERTASRCDEFCKFWLVVDSERDELSDEEPDVLRNSPTPLSPLQLLLDMASFKS